MINNHTTNKFMKKTRIIFLCTGNAARSQMAEAFLRKFAPEHFAVYSAGFEAKGVNPYTIKVMEEVGIDMSQHHSKNLDQYLGNVHFSITITVCDRAEEVCPTYPSLGKGYTGPLKTQQSLKEQKKRNLRNSGKHGTR